MTRKPRPISGNEPFDAIAKDYNRYCGRIVGDVEPIFPLPWELMYDLSDGASLATFANASGAAIAQESDHVTASYDASAAVETYTGIKIEGDWDASQDDIFSFEFGAPTTERHCRMAFYFVFDTGTTFNNYAIFSNPPTFADVPKFPRFKVNVNKSDTTVTGVADWSALRRIEIRFYRLVNVGANEIELYKVYSNVSQKAKVVMSFDDNYTTQYTEAFINYLEPNNLIATCYISSSNMDIPGRISTAQLQEMYGAGWAACSHTENHVELAYMPAVTRVGSVATAVLPVGHEHGLSPLDTVEITGFDDDAYNGNVIVDTTPDVNTFTYTVVGTPETPALGWGAFHRLTDQQISDEITGAVDYILDNSMPRAVNHFAYPFGYFSDKVIGIIQSLNISTARATLTGGIPMKHQISNVGGISNSMRMPMIEMNPTETAVNILAQVDISIERGGIIFIYGHEIVTPAVTSTEFPVAEFAALVAGLKSRVDAGLIDMIPIDRINQLK